MNYTDITGQRFGRLIAICPTKERKWYNVVWECQCDCGNITFVPISSLSRGDTKSCGCLQKQRARETFSKAPTVASFNALYSVYRRGAERRNLVFNLSQDEFRVLTKQDCFYCGQPPSQDHFRKNFNGSYIYNGIDRKDNTKDYTLDNCVPCCGICNFMKRTMNIEEFLSHLAKIAKYRSLA